jgi:hypothetical protein
MLGMRGVVQKSPQFFQAPDVVSESGCYGRGALLPAAPMSSGLTELDLQGAMRPYEIIDRIFQIDVAL